MIGAINNFFRRAVYNQLDFSQVASWAIIKASKSLIIFLSLLLGVVGVLLSQATILGSFQYLALLSLFGLIFTPAIGALIDNFGAIKVILLACVLQILSLLMIALNLLRQPAVGSVLLALVQALAISMFVVAARVIFSEINRLNKVVQHKLRYLRIELGLGLTLPLFTGLLAFAFGIRVAAIGLLIFTLVTTIFWLDADKVFNRKVRSRPISAETPRLLTVYFIRARQGMDLVVDLLAITLLVSLIISGGVAAFVYVNWLVIVLVAVSLLVAFAIYYLNWKSPQRSALLIAGSVIEFGARLLQVSLGAVGWLAAAIAGRAAGHSLVDLNFQRQELVITNTVGARLAVAINGLVAWWMAILVASLAVCVSLLQAASVALALQAALICLAVSVLALDGLIYYLIRRDNGF